MVYVAQSRPAALSGEAANDAADQALIAEALACAERAYGERHAPTGERVADHARELSSILAGLRTDRATQLAAVLYGTTDADRAEHPLPEDSIAARFGSDVLGMVRGIVQLMRVTELARDMTALREGAEANKRDRELEHNRQAEALRKMLLAMVGDLRVVLVRLASRLRTLRFFADNKDRADCGTPEQRRLYAEETMELYAPLANRLGIWQLKWEMEDLAFRFIEPEIYKRIAKELEEKRVEREAFITSAIARLRSEMKASGIVAEVSGRPKHIYSIWNKMRGKGLDFGGLYDVRAFRVITDDIKDCYTVLGIVHNLWQPIPKEFDDYISRPKANGYQSLHTVVVADDGKPFEVQIRTREMHQFAEYGVAAHWRYKEAGNRSETAGSAYDQKIAWIRQLFAWKNEVAREGGEEAVEKRFDAEEWADRLKSGAVDDRIYVLTPQARVIDLPAGSTPIDFAYHLHSDLGHRCRGARVDGAMVPLNTALRTGQTVEIIAGKNIGAGPSRDWLNPNLGYLASSRARTKVRAWFNSVEQETTMLAGRARIERELQRLGRTAVSLDEVASGLGYGKPDDLFTAAARDDFNLRQIEALFEEPQDEPELHPARIGRGKADVTKSGVLVVGIDKLLTQLAKCCKPAPPDAIMGFVTRGKGVSIHRDDCLNFLAMAERHPERVIETQWGTGPSNTVFPVDVFVLANDRQGLLRDISDVFARERINVIGVNTQSAREHARMQFTAEIADSAALTKALNLIRDVPGVMEARRK
ncbi:RelA/SpoT family protein [Derxia lacustris]|uniref:RelA/SpoT family protein n=1 Tax=Derxia lacustris TaxID=764842 RepID=UPI000A17330A|nr:bifunctional (p)ppGpp synthetase/guanosine-3',5'-bis(diphosphate) 3'-pyrophosphohydrolase [Derxia lacustris]